MRILFLCFIINCSPIIEKPSEVLADANKIIIDASVTDSSTELIDANLFDACLPEKLLESQVSRINSQCPPEIIKDPVWIPKWDPSPIIK